ncbi:MAG: class 1 fructose-bisphosphatase [Candidatus Nanosalina sp.]
MSEDVVDEIFHEVVEAVPHISSGIIHRREYLDEENPSNEEQLEADVWAHEFIKEKVTEKDEVGEFASEEEEHVTDCGQGVSVTVDPLDGSSNIPSNNLVGIIVGIYDDWLPCKGDKMIASFYIVFGPLMTAVKAERGDVSEYVIEPQDDDTVELHRTQENMVLPDPQVYGFGGGYQNWTPNFRDFHEDVREDLKLRYGGAMVGDVNQVVHYGGMFAYPELQDRPEGKLRLMFEANPMAYIFKCLGGASTTGEKSILDKEPQKLHQRTPVYIGNKKLINKLERKLKY